ncbi:MAG: hypothetical protein DMF02_01985 [Verrucomicrobia bacterium]|nr:MAG: hypothetical protein DMF02_01985 [Verrucomicrobiota bacterium]
MFPLQRRMLSTISHPDESPGSQWLQKFAESPSKTALLVFSIGRARCSRALKVSIFVPTSAARQHFTAMRRWRKFRCRTVFFWSNSGANGEINGYFAMQPEAEDSPFTTSVKFRNVLADQIVENAGGPKGMVKGKLEGSFQASGKTADPNALVGRGEIFLRDGRVQQYSLLVLLGQILQIEELQELHLEQAEAKYHLGPGLVTIDELVLRSPNIRLTASGTVAFDGRLKLDSRLAINDRIRGQLFKAIRNNFQPIDEPGYTAIDFQVGGTIQRPSTNLMDRLVGRDLSSMLNSFFGGKRDKPKKKKKQIEEAAPAAPERSPADNASGAGGNAVSAMPSVASPSASAEEAPSQAAATPTPIVSP